MLASSISVVIASFWSGTTAISAVSADCAGSLRPRHARRCLATGIGDRVPSGQACYRPNGHKAAESLQNIQRCACKFLQTLLFDGRGLRNFPASAKLQTIALQNRSGPVSRIREPDCFRQRRCRNRIRSCFGSVVAVRSGRRMVQRPLPQEGLLPWATPRKSRRNPAPNPPRNKTSPTRTAPPVPQGRRRFCVQP